MTRRSIFAVYALFTLSFGVGTSTSTPQVSISTPVIRYVDHARLGAPRASMTRFQLDPPQKGFKHIAWRTNVCLLFSACDIGASTSEFVPESHQQYHGSVQNYEMTSPDEPGSPPEDFRLATITVTDILTLLLLVAYIIYVTKAVVYKSVLCIQVSSASSS